MVCCTAVGGVVYRRKSTWTFISRYENRRLERITATSAATKSLRICRNRGLPRHLILSRKSLLFVHFGQCREEAFYHSEFSLFWRISFVGSLRATGLDTYPCRPSRQRVAGTRIRTDNFVEGKTLPQPLLGQEHHPQLQLAAALLQPRCGQHKPSCFWNRKVKSVWFWRVVCWLHVIDATALCVHGDQ
jgi:hypothetical protein